MMNMYDAIDAVLNNKGLAMHNSDWMKNQYVVANDKNQLVDAEGNLWYPQYMDTEGTYNLIMVSDDALAKVNNYPF